MRGRLLGLIAVCLAAALTAPTIANGQTLRAQAVVTSGLSNPLYLTAPPGDTNRLFILEKGGNSGDGVGNIRVFDLTTNTLLPTPYLSIPAAVDGERGLLGLAFDPNFATNGRLYTYHTKAGLTDPSRGDVIVSRYTANGNPLTSNTANAASGQTILTIDRNPGANNHNGGWMGFRPGGGNQLYIAVGDNGFNPDQMRNAQNTNVLLGKMLRIDVSGDTGYTNPADNAFPGGVGGRPEIYAYGLRNPWRDSFDRATGDLYIADVGESQREEINFQAGGTPGGQNYGWRVYEGTRFTGLETGPTTGLTFPIHEYDHGVGSSITGGYAYRGTNINGLQGDYIYGDFISGRIWTGERSGNTLANIVERTTQLGPSGGGQTWNGRLASFGEGANGELYMVGFNGAVYRIIPEPGTWLLSILAIGGLAIVVRGRKMAAC